MAKNFIILVPLQILPGRFSVKHEMAGACGIYWTHTEFQAEAREHNTLERPTEEGIIYQTESERNEI
jgi:hypothetical protein